MEYLETVVSIGPVVFFLLNAIATVTPTPKDNVALVWLKKIFNVLTLNIGMARNAEDVLTEQQRNPPRPRPLFASSEEFRANRLGK